MYMTTLGFSMSETGMVLYSLPGMNGDGFVMVSLSEVAKTLVLLCESFHLHTERNKEEDSP